MDGARRSTCAIGVLAFVLAYRFIHNSVRGVPRRVARNDQACAKSAPELAGRGLVNRRLAPRVSSLLHLREHLLVLGVAQGQSPLADPLADDESNQSARGCISTIDVVLSWRCAWRTGSSTRRYRTSTTPREERRVYSYETSPDEKLTIYATGWRYSLNMGDVATYLGFFTGVSTAITLVLGDKDDVVSWGGCENGLGSPSGSDWEKAHRALYPSSDAERAATQRDAYEDADGRRLFVRVRGSLGFDVVAIDVDCNGFLQVFAVGDALVIAGARCNQDDDDERDIDEEAPQALLDAMTAVADAETLLVGMVNCPSGKLACLPSTAPGKPFSSAMLSGAAVKVDLEVEGGLLVAVVKGTHRIVRREVKGPWGEADCVVLRPVTSAKDQTTLA